jgi:hypothetical protein
VKRVLAIAIALLAPGAIEAQRIQPEIRFETLGPEYQGLLGVIGRFTFDPNRQMRWALAAGGGLSYDAESKKLYLAVHSDLEGPRMGSISPFVSAGLAGGARFAVGMRRAFQNRR